MLIPGRFSALRLSLLAGLGLSLTGCGEEVQIDRNGSGGADGTGGAPTGGAGANGGGGGVGASGGGSTGGAGGAGAGGTGGVAGGGVCAGAVPVHTTQGTASGFEMCPDGTVHRVEPVTCSTDVAGDACQGTEDFMDCTSDADCTAKPHGFCRSFPPDFDPSTYCGCVYPCADDSECATGEICVCDGVVEDSSPHSTCVPAACVTGSECASGECGISSFFNGCYYEVATQCRDDGDACRTDAECAAAGGECALSADVEPAWGCQLPSCVIGRPLLVDGAPRTAPARARGDWRALPVTPRLEGLDPDVRDTLAVRWREVAAMEHASVASFARFTLELMALGAPPDLLSAAQRAAADEVEHARVAYALAGAYAGAEVGPARLDVSGVTIAADRRRILRGLIEEACVGETVGVAEAITLATSVDDPAVAEVHARIAEDEQRHAELAWRTLQWMMGDADADERGWVREVFERAMEEASRAPEIDGVVARAAGLLSSEELGAIRRQAIADVVRPCRDALLAEA